MGMTIQQAIENRERCLEYLERCAVGTSKECIEAVRLSLEALREKAEREDPKPLTFEELLHMDGQPVYVTVPGKLHRNKWCIVDLLTPCPTLQGINYCLRLEPFTIKAVKVYRHKPKEV